MAGYLLAGWDFGLIGTTEMRFSDDGGSFTITYNSGTYAHRDLSAAMGGGNYLAWITKLIADMNATSSGAGVYTGSWSATTGLYTIAYSAGNFTMTFDVLTSRIRMGQILGFAANQSGASSYVSTRTPYYFLALARDGMASYTRPFEVAGQTQRVVSINANAYSIGPTTYEKRIKGKLRFNTLAKVHADQASASVPWTYEHLLQHARAHEPVLISTTSTGDLVVKMIDAEFSEEARTPVWQDYHALWDLQIHAQRIRSI